MYAPFFHEISKRKYLNAKISQPIFNFKTNNLLAFMTNYMI